MHSKLWILFTARRIMRSRRKSRSSVTAVLSIFGLAVGVLTLITVIALMNGFQLKTIEDLIELNSFHLRIKTDNPDAVISALDKIPEVTTAVEMIESQALVQGYFNGSQAILLKAVDEKVFIEDPEFASRLDMGNTSPPGDGEIVLGRELARFLGVQKGDYISVLGLGGEDINFREPVDVELLVTGVFDSGYYEFDRNWGFISLNTAIKDFQLGFRREVAVKIADRDRDIPVINKIYRALPSFRPGSVESWREYNRGIFGALRVEKSMMAFLVGLIFLVVGVNIFQGLRRSVHERMDDIAVIKVLGASDHDVRMVFVLEGIIIGFIGTGIGLVLGLLISFNINSIFSALHIFSPSYFYLDKVPSKILPGEVLLITLLSFSSALVSAYAASRRISSLKPREVLNAE